MKFLRSTLGFFLAGLMVMSIWDAFFIPYGVFGGFLAALIIIFPMWYLNHYIGLIYEAPGAGYIDMGLGIGMSGLFRDFFMNGADLGLLAETLPTLLFVIVGAIIGGIIAATIENDLKADEDSEKGSEG